MCIYIYIYIYAHDTDVFRVSLIFAPLLPSESSPVSGILSLKSTVDSPCMFLLELQLVVRIVLVATAILSGPQHTVLQSLRQTPEKCRNRHNSLERELLVAPRKPNPPCGDARHV